MVNNIRQREIHTEDQLESSALYIDLFTVIYLLRS